MCMYYKNFKFLVYNVLRQYVWLMFVLCWYKYYLWTFACLRGERCKERGRNVKGEVEKWRKIKKKQNERESWAGHKRVRVVKLCVAWHKLVILFSRSAIYQSMYIFHLTIKPSKNIFLNVKIIFYFPKFSINK